MDIDDDEWGEDFLKLMLGEETFSAAAALSYPIDYALSHSNGNTRFNQGIQDQAHAESVSTPSHQTALEKGLNALEAALKQAGPNASLGPYTIPASDMGTLIRKHMGSDKLSKSIKIRDLLRGDNRFVFNSNKEYSTVSLCVKHVGSESASRDVGDVAMSEAMEAIFQAVSKAGQLPGPEAGVIFRKFISERNIKMRDIITQDGRFNFINPVPGGPGAVVLKSEAKAVTGVRPPLPPSPHEPTPSFMREKATPMWKKLR